VTPNWQCLMGFKKPGFLSKKLIPTGFIGFQLWLGFLRLLLDQNCYTVSQKQTHWLWNGIARNYKDQFWWHFFDVRFERRKVDKKAGLHENWSIQTILEYFEHFCQVSSKSILTILSYMVPFQTWCIFLRHSVDAVRWILSRKTINRRLSC